MTIVDRLSGVRGALAYKAPVKAATTANITLSGEQTIDGVSVVDGDYALVKDQDTGSENGIYVVSTGVWERRKDFNGPGDVAQGTQVLVARGSANALRSYRLTTAGPIEIGASDIQFAALLPATFNLTGDYSGGTVYSQLDVVTDQGSAWVYLNTTPASGNAPPTLPATENAHWQLFSQKGDKGDKGNTGSAGPEGVASLTVCRVVTASNIDLADELEAGDEIDGVTLAENDLVLVTGQTDDEDNGVYVVPASGAASRHGDFDAFDDHPGVYFSVMEGDDNADTLWRCTSDRGGTLDTDPIVIEEFEGGGGSAGVVTPEDFGAVGDGATDDSAAIQDMFDNLAGRRIDGLRRLGRVYRCDSGLTAPSGLQMDDIEFDFSNRGAGECLTISGSVGAGLALASNADRGDETITLADASSLSVGDWIVVSSGNGEWASGVTWNETHRITGIASNDVTFDNPLDYNYTTADSAEVLPLDYARDITIRRLKMTGDFGASGQDGVSFLTCLNVLVEDPEVSGFSQRAIYFTQYSKKTEVLRPTVSDATDGGTGYGVMWATGCEDGYAVRGTLRNMRHPTVVGGTALNRRCFAEDCVGYELLSGFDCHPGADLCGWNRCTSYMSDQAAAGEDGFVYQGNRLLAYDNRSINAKRHGVLIQPRVTDTAGAPAEMFMRGVEVEGAGGRAFYITPISGAQNVDKVTFVELRGRNLTEIGAYINFAGTDMVIDQVDLINCELVLAASSTQRVLYTSANTDSGGRVNILRVTGGHYARAAGDNAVIDMNGDPNNGSPWMLIRGATLIGGTHAIRTINANETVMAHDNAFKDQATAFSSLAGSGDSEDGNVDIG